MWTVQRPVQLDDLRPNTTCLPDRGNVAITKYCISGEFVTDKLSSIYRFSRSISSTPTLRLRPASTSSRCDFPDSCNSLGNTQWTVWTADNGIILNRLLCLPLAPSSWTSSAPDASPSPPSSLTPRPSLSALVARPSCASPPVARPDSLRDALSGGSKLFQDVTDPAMKSKPWRYTSFPSSMIDLRVP